MTSATPPSPAPLAGIRVLDMSRVLAGPWGAQMLGDLGADVIKVERPGTGDESRQFGPGFLHDRDGQKTRESAFYISANRNKRSITVDLSTDAGREIIRRLAVQSDILIENYKVGTLKRQGLDYDSLRKINPRLIYCSVTGYGQSGPYAAKPGYDAVFQAQGGLMSVTGHRDGEPGAGPMKMGPSLVDIMTGYNVAIAVLAALRTRETTGRGDYVDLALLDVAVAAMSHVTSQYLAAGVVMQRLGDNGNGGGPAQIVTCGDGRQLYMVAGNNDQFRRFAEAIERPDLPSELLYESIVARGTNWTSLRAIIDAAALTFTGEQFERRLSAAGVPCGFVNNVAEVFADPQVQHRGLTVELDHPLSGEVKLIANPIRFQDSAIRYDRAPPTAGQHTEEVLREIGMLPEEIDRHRQAGAI